MKAHHAKWLLTVALVAAPWGGASAQLPQASSAALGLGFNTTASARGFGAVANNPALLARSGAPAFSLALPAVAVETGLGPIRLRDLAEWEGSLVPTSVKTEWMDRVIASEGQAGRLGAGATALALSIGPVGFQLSSVVGGRTSLAPDAAELLLFGNAGRTGTPRNFELAGSEIDGFWLSTAALSLGLRVSPTLSVGITGKYTVGHGLLFGRDAGSLATSDPLAVQLDFPLLVNPSEDPGFDHGRGLGVDLGAVLELPTLTLGASIQNVLSTFEWDLEGFSYVAAQAFFAQDSTSSSFEEQPASGAPQSFLAAVAEQKLKPVYSVGAEWTLGPLLSLHADVRKRTSGGLELGPDFHAGVGAELRALGFLPLRAHLAAVSGGVQLGGGASLVLGPFHLGGAAALRTGKAEDAVLAMVTLSLGAG